MKSRGRMRDATEPFPSLTTHQMKLLAAVIETLPHDVRGGLRRCGFSCKRFNAPLKDGLMPPRPPATATGIRGFRDLAN